MDEENQNGAGNQNGDGGAKSVELDGRVYGAEEVKALIEAQAKGTQAMQTLAKVTAVAEKYGLDPEGLVQQAEGSFAAVSRLIDEGLIDQEGNIIKPGAQKSAKTNDPLAALLGTGNPQENGQLPLKGPDKAILDALQGIKSQTQEAHERMKKLEADNASLTRHILKGEIKAAHPDLTDEDVSRVFGLAQADGSKGLLEHAAALAETKKEQAKSAEVAFAKKYGIDLEAFQKANAQNDKGPEGGSSILKGRKVSFKAKPGDPNVVTPQQAAAEFLDKAEM